MIKSPVFTSFLVIAWLLTGLLIGGRLVAQEEYGEASYYSDKFHLKNKTASGELYDKYDYTAAHRTLPFQTWVRVTNLDNGRSVQVRINDRGPFKPGRIVDLSRIAAEELDMIASGVARVKLDVLSMPSAPQDPSPLPTPQVQPSSPSNQSSASVPTPNPNALPLVDPFGNPLPSAEDNNEMPPSTSKQAAQLPAGMEDAQRYTPALFRMVAFKEEATGYGIQIGAYFSLYRLFEAMDELAQQGYQNTLVQNSLKDGKPVFRILIGPYPTRDDAKLVQRSLSRKKKKGFIIDLRTLR